MIAYSWINRWISNANIYTTSIDEICFIILSVTLKEAVLHSWIPKFNTFDPFGCRCCISINGGQRASRVALQLISRIIIWYYELSISKRNSMESRAKKNFSLEKSSSNRVRIVWWRDSCFDLYFGRLQKLKLCSNHSFLVVFCFELHFRHIKSSCGRMVSFFLATVS